MEAEAMPLPRELHTPPVTNTNFGTSRAYRIRRQVARGVGENLPGTTVVAETGGYTGLLCGILRAMNLWQSQQWEQLQSALGHRVFRIDGVVVLEKQLPGGFCSFEVQRASPAPATWQQIRAEAAKRKAVFARIAPAQGARLEIAETTLPSPEEHFPPASRIIDLTPSEDEIIAGFSQTGRRHLRTAQKATLHIQQSDDVAAYARLAKETAARDGFGVHGAGYYRQMLDVFGTDGFLLAIRQDAEWLAAGIYLICEGTCTYYYGASASAAREVQPATLLQWEAMKIAKARGCDRFDLFGIAPPDQPQHRLAGVSRFKQKFGGDVVLYPPERIVVFRPLAYRAYRLAKGLRSLLR